jgi:MFS transporter, FSR family, fosmidomycin resistance protein
VNEAAVAAPLRRDAEVISLVGVAHGTSHFFHLLLPPLFPWLMVEFDLSFTRAGALMTAFYVTSGIGQAAAGFVVDRIGARRVLVAGLALFVVAGAVLGLADAYPTLLAAAIVAGLGNSVFHPADFTLLNRRVSPSRLGHGFSAHALSGNLGWAAAPVFMTAVAVAGGWRSAAFAAALVPLAPIALLLARRASLAGAPARRESTAPSPPRATPFSFLALGTVWLCFLFFLVSTMSFGALQNFAPTVFEGVYGLSLRTATTALTVYLLGGAAGVVAGGFLAARHRSHENVIAAMLLAAALGALGLATGGAPREAILPAMALIGFCTGAASPSRDMLVRKSALAHSGQDAFGRIYGFVYSGLDVGLALAPLLFGRLLDGGLHRPVLGGVAALQVLAVATALAVGRSWGRAPQPAAPVAAPPLARPPA